MQASHLGRTSWLDEEIVVVVTPHFKEDWAKSRYGKSRTKTLSELLGGWSNPSQGFYEDLMNAPLGKTMYAVVRSRRGLKPIAFLYFRNIKNEIRNNRRELELISITPPVRGQTEGWNMETMHHHADTECWVEILYQTW